MKKNYAVTENVILVIYFFTFGNSIILYISIDIVQVSGGNCGKFKNVEKTSSPKIITDKDKNRFSNTNIAFHTDKLKTVTDH